MQKGPLEHSPDISNLLGDAREWALKNIKSNDLMTRGMAERLLSLQALHTNLSSAVAKISQHKIELPADLAAELGSFRLELKDFILQVLPGAGTSNAPKSLAAPKGTILRVNELNRRAQQLLQRASAAPTVLERLPLRYKCRRQPPAFCQRPKKRLRKRGF